MHLRFDCIQTKKALAGAGGFQYRSSGSSVWEAASSYLWRQNKSCRDLLCPPREIGTDQPLNVVRLLQITSRYLPHPKQLALLCDVRIAFSKCNMM